MSCLAKSLVIMIGYMLMFAYADVKFINIVGIEGVGHHAVGPIILSIIQACHGNHRSGSYISPIAMSFESKDVEKTRKIIKECGPNDVFFSPYSYPAGKSHRIVNRPNDIKRNYMAYDLELKFKHLTAAGVDPKHLYLHRNLYEAISSHEHFDHNFENHTRVMGIYLKHILQEFNRIDAVKKGLWKRLEYSHLQSATNVKAVLNAMVQFFGWDPRNCEMKGLIANVMSHIHPPHNRTVDEAKKKWVADNIKVNMDVIPPLVPSLEHA